MRTGLHCNTTRDEAKLLDYYRRSGSNVVKVMEFHGPTLDKLKALGVTIIGRVYEDEQKLAGTKAGDFIAKVVQHARDFPQVDYWEGYNEAFSDGDDMNRFADMEILRMRALELVGKRAIIACFSTGTPEIEDWPRFRPALEYAATHGHALGLHEYSGPFMQWLCGENQWDHARGAPKRTDDRCLSSSVEGWLTLRYRKAYALFKQWGIGDLPLFITEGGIDDVQPRPGPQGKGYKDFAGTEWARLPGMGDYAEGRRWYMWQVSHDRYMKGVVDFGWDDASGKWGSFRLDDDDAMRNRIIALEASLPVGHLVGGNVPMPTLTDILLAEAAKRQTVQLNPGSGFQRAMLRDAMCPTSPEFDVSVDGKQYRGQRAESLASGAVRVYYAEVGHWDRVQWVDRPKS